MSNGCSGYGSLETDLCRKCHAEGGSWFHRPDGSYGCTYTSNGKQGNSLTDAIIIGVVLLALVVGATQLDK